jgi:hypothetical protein
VGNTNEDAINDWRSWGRTEGVRNEEKRCAHMVGILQRYSKKWCQCVGGRRAAVPRRGRIGGITIKCGTWRQEETTSSRFWPRGMLAPYYDWKTRLVKPHASERFWQPFWAWVPGKSAYARSGHQCSGRMVRSRREKALQSLGIMESRCTATATL